MANKRLLGAFVVAVFLLVWGPNGSGQTPVALPPVTKGTVFVVGDIVQQGFEPRAQVVGELMKKSLDETPNSIAFLNGDNSNDSGCQEDFDRVDKTIWGELNSRYRGRVFAVVGNHELWCNKTNPFHFFYWYNSAFETWGNDWFDFFRTGWRLFRVNSESMERSTDTLQRLRRKETLDWFSRELQLVPSNVCTAVFLHRPPFSSGNFASPAWVMPLYHLMYRVGNDYWASGHDHIRDQLPPLDPDGNVNWNHGIYGDIVGTGGAIPHSLVDPVTRKTREPRWKAYGEEVSVNVLGILRLDVEPGRLYRQFVPVAQVPGVTYPRTTVTCHGNPPGYIEPLDNPNP
ncbi:MAG: metallophosphoesterase [bacterium]|nr:metallophosphoesterase [bacterium]